MTAVLINPNLVVQRSDPFTTGVVFMPFGLASVAASLRGAGFEVRVIDAFGEAPRRSRRSGPFQLLGLTPEEVASRLPADAEVVFLFANQLINHASLAELLRALAQAHPRVPRVVLENTQAVTAYSLAAVAEELFSCGADYLLCGEGEERSTRLLRALRGPAPAEALRRLDGLSAPGFSNPPTGFIEDLDALPFPAWDLFPVAGYWGLRFAHGPQSTPRYLPLLTSRGCPYPCKFCVVPATNAMTWRARSAKSVVDEIELLVSEQGVREFHIEDLNPTIKDERIREICRELLRRRLDVVWKIAAGTKVESIKSEETLELMARAGCRYISISPETGSKRVLKLIGKPFKEAHAVRLIRAMNELNIRSQACFVLGFPGETPEDLALTREMALDLTRAGLDEIALFIVAPVPGAEIFSKLDGYGSLSELNFTPTWRPDFEQLNRFRIDLYRRFLVQKLRSHPRKIARQALNFATRRFETKMEMVPYKALLLKLLDRRG